MKYIFIALMLLLAWPAATFAQGAQGAPHGLPDGLYTEITTEAGVVVCELFYMKAPLTVTHYVGLAEGTVGPKKGQPFFEGLAWHRVVANFVVQGGDGGRLGYSFPDEIVPGLRHEGAGTLQMANAGPDTNGSQYCLMLSEQHRLNYNHPVFGKVVRGLDVLPNIQQGNTMKVKILRLGADAQAFKADQEAFDALLAKAKRWEGDRNAGPDNWVHDPDGLIGTQANYVNGKLGNVQRFINQRIFVRPLVVTPPEAAGDKLDAYLTGLLEKFKIEKGAIVVFFQDQNRWVVKIAKGSEVSFISGPVKPDGTRDPVPAGWNMEQAMAQYLAVATPARGGRGNVATQPATTPATNPVTSTAPAGRGRGRGGAGGGNLLNRLNPVLDNLIFRLEPGTP